jgi:N12 class adenine-specific DNA methylase
VRLRVAYSAFIRYFGPINHTVITTVTDPETGEERETHRRPNCETACKSFQIPGANSVQ